MSVFEKYLIECFYVKHDNYYIKQAGGARLIFNKLEDGIWELVFGFVDIKGKASVWKSVKVFEQDIKEPCMIYAIEAEHLSGANKIETFASKKCLYSLNSCM